MKKEIFETYESNVRSYCRNYSKVLKNARNALIYAEDETRYIDFLAGAGALNYGHNNEYIKNGLIKFMESDYIMHGLDMYTLSKGEFIESFVMNILKPRGLDYKFQFCGPTGTNAVEASLKLARKVKNRMGIFSFMGGFHGMSMGSLAATGNKESRAGAGLPLGNVTFMPYPFGFMKSIDSIAYIENVITDSNSGIEKPAAVILETVQAEGGVIVAPDDWLIALRKLCTKHDILLICDDIQVGCGRTGTFFSFERAGIVPDIVILSKSVSGYGLPMSMLLMKPELDIWKAGEHNGTFRGYQLSFVGAELAIQYRELAGIDEQTHKNAKIISDFLTNEIKPLDEKIAVRGIGMIWGIDLSAVKKITFAREVVEKCFACGLIIECVGRDDTVLKILPPLTIETNILLEGLQIIKSELSKMLIG